MKFSVVIPCYNAEHWIEQTLTSVLSQTLLPKEVFVIDDGSQDHSVSLVKTISDRSSIPITLLHSNRQGPAEARNLGIDAATGDWIAFLDADDWWDSNHLERIYTAVNTSQDVLYLAAAQHFSINVNRVVSCSDTPFLDVTPSINHQTYFNLYQKHGLLELSSSAVQRDHLLAVGRFNPAFRGAEDFEMVMRVVYNHTLVYDPVPSSYYRCSNPESHSQKFSTQLDCLTASFRALQSLQEHYAIPDALLSSQAKTLVSKSMMLDKSKREKVLQLTWSYLSPTNQLIFRAASIFPPAYLWLNTVRNKLRGPQYAPRQVVPQGNLD